MFVNLRHAEVRSPSARPCQEIAYSLENRFHITSPRMIFCRRLEMKPSSPRSNLAARCASFKERRCVCTALRNIDWPEALLFDCDGVLVDTEAEGHRIAFNETFAKYNLPHQWSLEEYGRLLEVGGGKERMDFFFSERENEEPWKSIKGSEERKAFLKELHMNKTDIFNELIESGKLPVRPGVIRLINEAIDAGVKVAVCSTSNERAVSNIVRVMLGDKIAEHMKVYAGDVVPKKKPAPDIYLLAAKELDVDPARCVVIEDSKIGLAAGKAAGMRVIITESSYTKGEDFTLADAVFDCIGEAGEERFSLHDLTTPGTFWLNPPLPMDEQGNWLGPIRYDSNFLFVDVDLDMPAIEADDIKS